MNSVTWVTQSPSFNSEISFKRGERVGVRILFHKQMLNFQLGSIIRFPNLPEVE